MQIPVSPGRESYAPFQFENQPLATLIVRTWPRSRIEADDTRVVEVRGGLGRKEVIEQIAGTWIIEFAELAGMASREREKIISFLSRQVDRARPAYGRHRENARRQFIACGTTNDTEYLPRDERRMWPVRIKQFDLGALSRDIDQLWAEADYYEKQGVSITLAEELWPEAEKVRATRVFENPYQSILAKKLGNDILVTMPTVWSILDILPDRQQGQARRVGQAMQALGFVRKRAWRDGDPKGCNRGDCYYERSRGSKKTG